jgi:hypothetical protein
MTHIKLDKTQKEKQGSTPELGMTPTPSTKNSGGGIGSWGSKGEPLAPVPNQYQNQSKKSSPTTTPVFPPKILQ